LTVVSCGDDEVTQPPPPRIEFKNLRNQDDILFNLELAYNERNPLQYIKLLDDDFIFVFSVADFNSGKVKFEQWDRDAEVTCARLILDPNLAADNRIVTIDLKLDYTKGDWEEEPANENHPGESWYTKTAQYDLTMKTADQWEYNARGLQAEFTIRWGETEDGEHWRIVVWRDDVGSSP
jgi:hypothetical protein